MSKYLKFKTPATDQAKDLKSRFGLENHGLVHLDRVYWNLPEPALYEEAGESQQAIRADEDLAKNAPDAELAAAARERVRAHAAHF